MSEPAYRKRVFYYNHCKAFRITYEQDKEKLFTMFLDGIDFSAILAPRITKGLTEAAY